jgi:anaerobic selenocysteine-containing dehydrogenase
MNQHAKVDIRHSTCPHDCPSACALDIEVIDGRSIGRVAAPSCRPIPPASSARRSRATPSAFITRPAASSDAPHRTEGLRPVRAISWDEALDEIAARFDQAEREFGAQSVWPYYYAGTMGLVMRDGINRLAHVKKYSRFYGTICATIARIGFAIGTGKIAGVDPREMGVSDLVVIWGTNPVNTQVNVMTHASRARKERGREDRGHRCLQQRHDEAGRYQDTAPTGYRWRLRLRRHERLVPRGLRGSRLYGSLHRLSRRARGAPRDPHTGMGFSDLGRAGGKRSRRSRACRPTKRSFFRLGYGFTRSRNGAAQMHAALCIPAVTGAWQYEGGGAFFNNAGIWKFDESIIEGHDAIDRTTRWLDQSQIGRILTGDAEA